MAKRNRVTVEVDAKDVLRVLDIMPDDIAREHLMAATMVGGEVLRKKAVEKAPKRSGDLAGSITLEPEKSKNDQATVKIGPTGKGFYGLFVEFGHALVRGSKKKDKKTVGNVAPHPFMRPALDEGKDEAEAAMASDLRRRLRL